MNCKSKQPSAAGGLARCRGFSVSVRSTLNSTFPLEAVNAALQATALRFQEEPSGEFGLRSDSADIPSSEA